MLIAQIRGGLGNQFFVYAFAYAQAKRNGVKLFLDDYRYVTTYTLRSFKLCDYNLTFSKNMISKAPRKDKLSQLIYKIWSRIISKIYYKAINIQEDVEFCYQEVEIKKNKNYYLKGYWQVHEYFDDCREDLRREFTLKRILPNISHKGEWLKSVNSCAIHVRRGDYVTFKGGKCLNFSYYIQAVQEMLKRDSQMTFIVFSDNIDYCKMQFSFLDNVEYISNMNISDEEELFLMSCCRNFIIANSSFSWWGAYLAENAENVICPVVDMWKEDFYLPEWTKIATQID